MAWGEGCTGVTGGGVDVARGLWFGSADPHGVGDIDKVPPPKRAPALSMGMHVAAAPSEMEVRAFAVSNAPPPTEWREPPPPVNPGAPVITAVEQLVPAAQLKTVRLFRRRLRRCYLRGGKARKFLAGSSAEA